MGGVKDHKANTSLTVLKIDGNKVGDSGAPAPAEAVKATDSRVGLRVRWRPRPCHERKSSGKLFAKTIIFS